MENPDRREISVIVSCFNEEDNIEKCLRRIVRTVPGAEVLVIHGGKDRTADIAETVALEHPGIRVIRNKEDRGKGHAVKVGVREASADIMVQMDADLQFMPEEIPEVVRPIRDGRAAVSFGCRFMKRSNVENYRFDFLRVLGNRVVNGYVSLLGRQEFRDVTTGFKAWTRRAIDDIAFKDDGFVYEVEIALRASLKGYRVAMVPITYCNRLGGFSGHGRGWRESASIALTGARILVFATMIRLSLW